MSGDGKTDVRTGRWEGKQYVYLHVIDGQMTPDEADALADLLKAAASKARQEGT